MTMLFKVTKTFQWGQHSVTMETGESPATGAVLVDIGIPWCWHPWCAKTQARSDFSPDRRLHREDLRRWQDSGSFFKREAKSSELETLTSRLMTVPSALCSRKVSSTRCTLVIHVVSVNPEVSADIAAMIASSAALSISGIPFNGPIGAACVGYINGEY